MSDKCELYALSFLVRLQVVTETVHVGLDVPLTLALDEAGRDTHATQAYTALVDDVCMRLSALFAAQADCIQDCQGEEASALIWLQRADQVRTCAHVAVPAQDVYCPAVGSSSASLSVPMPRLQSHMQLQLLRKLSRSSYRRH